LINVANLGIEDLSVNAKKNVINWTKKLLRAIHHFVGPPLWQRVMKLHQREETKVLTNLPSFCKILSMLVHVSKVDVVHRSNTIGSLNIDIQIDLLLIFSPE
jgi:hypothetical protein